MEAENPFGLVTIYFDPEMKIHLEQIKTNHTFHGKKIRFRRFRIRLKCDELVIGEEEGIQLRKQKREQQLFKRRNVHTEEIIQVIFNGILLPKFFLPSVGKKLF